MSVAPTIDSSELVGAHIYLADYSPDVVDLANALVKIPPDKAVPMAALILGGGLMQTSQWWLRLCHRVVMWRTKQDAYASWLSLLSANEKTKEVAEDVIMQTATHAVYGHDILDEDSVGGFCQDEINRLSWCMHLMQVTDDEN